MFLPPGGLGSFLVGLAGDGIAEGSVGHFLMVLCVCVCVYVLMDGRI